MELQCRSNFHSSEKFGAVFILMYMCCIASDPTITVHLLTSQCPRTLEPETYLPTYLVTAASSVELPEAV